MPHKGKSQGDKKGLGRGGNKEKATTKLPPKNYIQIKDREETAVPNLINIYRHEYKSKHFQFGTSLATKEYQKELEEETEHCKHIIKELDMTGDDLRWVGDKITH